MSFEQRDREKKAFVHIMKWQAITIAGICLYSFVIWLVAGRFPPPPL